MDAGKMAEVKEETTLTKIRLFLNEQKIKLWEPPYFDKTSRKTDEAKVHELAVIVRAELELPVPYLFQGLLMLQQNALEKLAARQKYDEQGVLNLRLRCASGLKSRAKNVEIKSSETGGQLLSKIGTMVDRKPEMLRLICSGKVIQEDKELNIQGIKTSSTVMVVPLASVESVQIVSEQRRLLEQTRKDAERLGGRQAHKDEYFLQVADQSGKSLDLPAEERKSLLIAMSLHEKGRAALAQADYSLSLVLLLEAECEFSLCRSELVQQVDNFAILNLDIVWCYLMLQAISELPNAAHRLEVCERKFKDSYGTNLERLQTIKGSTGQEAALLMRLHLLQGIVAFHQGREREAVLLLKKTQVESELLDVNEQMLYQIVDLGYTVKEARLGLRSSRGNLDLAVEHINRRREEREHIRAKEEEERASESLRERLGRCAEGSWINVGYYKTLLRMGFTEKVSAAALKQANNSLNQAVQLLQEEPDLLELATKDEVEFNEEDVVRLVSLDYTEEMARIALKNEEDVEKAAESLLVNEGVVTPDEDGGGGRGKRRRKEKKDDKEAYLRIKDGIAEDEEDHLDIDLKLEKEFLVKYLELSQTK